MPLCVGRANGPGVSTPCPANRDDGSVRCRQGDLMLCDACDESRFPIADEVPEPTTADKTVSSPVEWVKNEMLCFITDKSAVIAVEQLIEICVKFYKEEEILMARQVVWDAGVRIPKRQSGNKLTATVEDIVKAILKPKVQFPAFFAANLSRLPPVDIKHCDTSAILLELQGLRAEVRDIAKLQAEVTSLRAETQSLRSDLSYLHSLVHDRSSELQGLTEDVNDLLKLKTELKSELSTCQLEIAKASTCYSGIAKLNMDMQRLSVQVAELSKLDSSVSAPPVPGNGLNTRLTSSLPVAVPRSVASVVSEAARTGALQQQTLRRPQKVAIGTSQSQRDKLQPAKMMKPVNVFVSRLNPDTQCEKIIACVCDAVKEAMNISLSPPNIRCEKLKTKYDTYASFLVTVLAEGAVKEDIISLLMSGDAWPEGILVRKYYYNRRNV